MNNTELSLRQLHTLSGGFGRKGKSFGLQIPFDPVTVNTPEISVEPGVLNDRPIGPSGQGKTCRPSPSQPASGGSTTLPGTGTPSASPVSTGP